MENVSEVVKPSLRNIMRLYILFYFICFFIFTGCSSVGEKFRSTYDPKYQVYDKGGLDAVVKGRSCAMTNRDAVAGAKQSAEYHLRSVIGNQRYIPKFEEVRRYSEDGKYCVEMSVSAAKP